MIVDSYTIGYLLAARTKQGAHGYLNRCLLSLFICRCVCPSLRVVPFIVDEAWPSNYLAIYEQERPLLSGNEEMGHQLILYNKDLSFVRSAHLPVYH